MNKTFCSFTPSFKEARLMYEDAPVTPPAQVPPKEPEPGSAEARVKGALDAKSTAEKALADAQTELKKYQDAEKQRQEDEAKAKGEHEKLAEQYKGESVAEKQKREAAEAKVKVYEDHLKARVEADLKAITDAEKQKAAQGMLEGLSIEEQMKRLPDIMKLVGASSTGFGTTTPKTDVNSATTEQKKARFSELLAKKELTPQERNEKHRLSIDLGKDWKPVTPKP